MPAPTQAAYAFGGQPMPSPTQAGYAFGGQPMSTPTPSKYSVGGRPMPTSTQAGFAPASGTQADYVAPPQNGFLPRRKPGEQVKEYVQPETGM